MVDIRSQCADACSEHILVSGIVEIKPDAVITLSHNIQGVQGVREVSSRENQLVIQELGGGKVWGVLERTRTFAVKNKTTFRCRNSARAGSIGENEEYLNSTTFLHVNRKTGLGRTVSTHLRTAA